MTAQRLFARDGNAVLVIEETSDGIYLYEFRVDGFVGDAWHQSLDEAKQQAAYAFGTEPAVWRPVPATVTDLREFALGISD